MSEFAKKVQRWYKMGLWSARRVKDALELGRITDEEYAQIMVNR
ncbi:MAG: XkdX family protein [Synergistaceae bacterium]|nr:XkdX family protein [Synergistaceae bacterium]